MSKNHENMTPKMQIILGGELIRGGAECRFENAILGLISRGCYAFSRSVSGPKKLYGLGFFLGRNRNEP